MWWTLVDVLAALAGFILGRLYERHVIYRRLLSSSDPLAWNAAHRVQTDRQPKQHSEDSDTYPATPGRQFEALRPTRKVPDPPRR